MQVRIRLSSLMRIRIQLFTFMRIRILLPIKVMGICGLWSLGGAPFWTSRAPFRAHKASILSFHGPPRLFFEPLQLLNLILMRSRLFTQMWILIQLQQKCRSGFPKCRVAHLSHVGTDPDLWQTDTDQGSASCSLRHLPTSFFCF